MDVYTDPMLNVQDAARYLGVPASTLNRWKAGGVVHAAQAQRKGWPNLPFVGVVEAFVLDRLRKMGVPLRHIKDTARAIRERLDDDYGLARPGLAVHGRDILIDVAGDFYRGSDLQQAATETLADLSQVISWSGKNPQRLKLTNLGADIILDPRFGWGRPVFERNKVPVSALAGQWLGGDSIAEIATDFDMTSDEVERVVQGYLASGEARPAA